AFLDLDETSRMFIVVHEVFHCFQAQLTGLKQHRDKRIPRWILESSADWAAADIVGVTKVQELHWRLWFEAPQYALDTPFREYSAGGLFAEAAYLGTPVWRDLPGILHSTTTQDVLRWLTTLVSDRFRRSWAASLLREPTRGREWDVTGNGVPPFRVNP